MFCKYCGTKLIDAAAFCHECGKSTHEQPTYAPPVQPVQPVYPQAAPQPVQPVYQPQPVQPFYQQPAPQPVYQQPVPPQYTYTVPANPVQPESSYARTPELVTLENQALTFGILGLCLSMLGVPGIIFSCIGARKAGILKQKTGSLTGKALVGFRLAKAGRIVSIAMTVIWFILLSTLETASDFDFENPFGYYDF